MKFSKHARRLLALLLSVIVMCLPAMEAFAASQVVIYCVNLPRGGDPNKSNWGHGTLKLMNGNSYPSSDHFVAKAVNSYTGKMAYCVEPGKALSDSTSLSASSNFWTNLSANKSLSAAEQKAFVARIMYYGYSGAANINWSSANSTHANEMGNMIATQILIWETLIGERNSSFGKVDAAAYGANNIIETISGSHPIRSYIMSNYNRIASAVQSQTSYPSFMSTNSGSAPTYELLYDSSTGKYSKTFSDNNGVLSGFSLSSNTSGVELARNGNSLTISMNSAISGTATVTAARSSGTVSGMIVWAAGSSQSVVTYGENVTDSQTAYLKFTVKETNGRVSVTKRNEAGAALSGVTFNIYADASCTAKIGSMVTNGSGEAVSGDINVSAYPTVYVREYSLSAADAERYKLNTTVYSARLSPGSTVATNGGSAVVNEWKDAYVRLLKKDEAGQPLSGVTFSVYSDAACTSRITTITTGSDGYGTSPAVDVGTSGSRMVYVKESSMTSVQNAVYKMNGTVYPVTINAGQTSSANGGGAIVNEWREGYIKVLKQNEAGTALAGVVFTVYSDSACTKPVTTITTGSDGCGTSAALDVGTTGSVTLYVRETSITTAQKSLYKMNPNAFSVNVGAGATAPVNNGAAVVNDWLPAKISVTKVLSSGAKLPGAVFTAYADKDCKTVLTDMSGKNVVLKTDANGYAVSTDIHVGQSGARTVYIKETALDNPDADIIALNGTVFPAVLQPNVTTAINDGKSVVNEYKPGRIMVVKENENGNRLAGITFSVYTDKACRTLLTTMVTDEHGVAVSQGIPIDGTGERLLYVRETAMTEEQRPLYELSTTVYPVTIFPNQTIQANNGRPIVNRWTLGQISLEKQDEDGAPVEGVVFAVYEDADCVTPLLGADGRQVRMTTGSDGKALSEGIEVKKSGTRKLYVKEYSMSESCLGIYEMNETVFPVAITAGTVSALNGGKPVVNLFKTTVVRITKEDVTTAEGVPGAVIRIFNADGKKVYEGTTGDDGKTEEITLRVGKYTFAEVVAPAGYVLNKTVFEFEITPEKEIVGDTTVTDKPVEWTIIKTDVTTAEPLPGAEITIYDSEGKEVFKDVTAEDGTVTAFRLPAGEYTFRETAAPEGYVLNETVFGFTVDSEGNVTGDSTVTDRRIIGGVRLVKTDSETKAVLAGAVFALFRGEEKLAESATDENGVVSFSDIEYGEYAVREVKAPTGYVLDNKSIEVSIREDGKVVELAAENRAITGVLRITKTDRANGKLIPKAGFRIKDESGKVVAEGYTDNKGVAEFNLRYGKYTYQEFEAPDGYKIDEREYPFEITEDGQIVEVGMTNELIPVEAPQTGVGSLLGLWLGMLCSGILGLVVLMLLRRKGVLELPDFSRFAKIAENAAAVIRSRAAGFGYRIIRGTI